MRYEVVGSAGGRPRAGMFGSPPGVGPQGAGTVWVELRPPRAYPCGSGRRRSGSTAMPATKTRAERETLPPAYVRARPRGGCVPGRRCDWAPARWRPEKVATERPRRSVGKRAGPVQKVAMCRQREWSAWPDLNWRPLVPQHENQSDELLQPIQEVHGLQQFRLC